MTLSKGPNTGKERSTSKAAKRAKLLAESKAKRQGSDEITAQIIPTPQPRQKTDAESIKDAAVPLKRLGQYLIGKLAKLPSKAITINRGVSIAMEGGQLIVQHSKTEYDYQHLETGILTTKIVFDGKTGRCLGSMAERLLTHKLGVVRKSPMVQVVMDPVLAVLIDEITHQWKDIKRSLDKIFAEAVTRKPMEMPPEREM